LTVVSHTIVRVHEIQEILDTRETRPSEMEARLTHRNTIFPARVSMLLLVVVLR